MEIAIEKKKIQLIQWLSTLSDSETIEALIKFKENQKDWWDDTPKKAKDSIDRGLKDIESGRIHPQNKAYKLYGKHL